MLYALLSVALMSFHSELPMYYCNPFQSPTDSMSYTKELKFLDALPDELYVRSEIDSELETINDWLSKELI